MSVPVKGSFVGRFALKFVEVLGAGIATAVGSYMVAQLSGYWSSPAHSPPAVQVAPGTAGNPNASVVSKSPRVDADASKSAPAPDAAAPAAAPPSRSAATVNPPGSRKRAPAEASVEAKSPENKSPENKASENKPPEKEAKSPDKEATETKPRDKTDPNSVEAQVRAALANVDAGHQPPPSPQPAVAPGAPKAETPPSTASATTVPRPAEIAPPPAPSPAQAAPLSPVEIKSHPIADVDAAQADAQAKAEPPQGNDRGLFAAFKKIPEFFRTDSHPAEDPPRPPQPVGD